MLLKPLITSAANLHLNGLCGWKFPFIFLSTFVLNGDMQGEDDFIKGQELEGGSQATGAVPDFASSSICEFRPVAH